MKISSEGMRGEASMTITSRRYASELVPDSLSQGGYSAVKVADMSVMVVPSVVEGKIISAGSKLTSVSKLKSRRLFDE